MLGMMLLVVSGFGLAVWNSYRVARRRSATARAHVDPQD